MTKLTDYGIVLMTHIANAHADELHNAKELAKRSHIPLPMVTKILKILTKESLLLSHRGSKGGYSLARPATHITLAEIIAALEGPIALSACVVTSPEECEHIATCPVTGHIRKINDAIRGALSGICLLDLSSPMQHQAHSALVAIS